jgi:hypothetical protein
MSKRKKTRTGTSLGKTNRRKGHNAERHYAHLFKTLGFKHCQTSRYGSRIYDDCGIDLINLPFLIQIKAGKQKNMKPVAELKNIADKVKENFPGDAKEQSLPKAIIHRRDCGRGVKRTEYHDTITLTIEDFSNIIKQIKNDT